MQVFATPAGWREQYERMLRWHERFEKIEQGRVHDVASENYLDEIYAFFQNCYHLKDWFKNDSSLSAAIRSSVENHINSERPLRLSADICNGLKHLERKKDKRSDRSKENPKFGRKQFYVGLGNKAPTTISLRYEINTDTGSIDAFALAGDCINSWEKFARGHRLL